MCVCTHTTHTDADAEGRVYSRGFPRRRCRDMADELRPEDNFRNMATTAGIRTSALMDIVVSLVAVPLLVIFSILLESNMRGDWTNNDELRWNVFGLGLALLFVSLAVCCYVIHRLGMCFWKAQAGGVRGLLTRPQQNTTTAPGSSVDSQLNLVAGNELPPSYDSVVDMSTPPSYFNVVLQSEMKDTPEKIPTVSQTVQDR